MFNEKIPSTFQCIKEGVGNTIYICTKCGRLYTGHVERCCTPRCISGYVVGIDMSDPRITNSVIEIYKNYNVAEVVVYRPSLTELESELRGYEFLIYISKENNDRLFNLFKSTFTRLKGEQPYPLISFDWLDANPEAITLAISTVTQLPEDTDMFMEAVASKYEAWTNVIERFTTLLRVENERRK